MTSIAQPDSEHVTQVWQTLHYQLERLRRMQHRYSDLFFELIVLSVILIILMTAASLTDTLRGVVLLIPFYVIYAGVHSAYLLSHIIVARVYATGIEQRINQLLKDDLLIAHRLEAVFLFPLGRKHFGGISLGLQQTLFGFMTIHLCVLGVAVTGLSVYRAWQLYEELMREFPPVCYYFIALGAWALLNLAYLVWYFTSRHYEHRLKEIVSASFGTEYDES
jgi:hypothetical protein